MNIHSNRLLFDFITNTHLGTKPYHAIIGDEIRDMLTTLNQMSISIRNKTDDITEESIGPLGRTLFFLRSMMQRTEIKNSIPSDDIYYINEDLDNIEKILDVIGEYCIKKRQGLN